MKRLTAFFAALIMVMALLVLPAPLEANAESLYIRKIVSVVYDDSGSMESDGKWAFANYAMQTFCGMLNSEDQLYITYMSPTESYYDYEPEQIDLSSSGIQGSVNSIRQHSDSGSTPYTAVEVAFDKLKSVQDDNINTQYWLVLLTDGAFNEFYDYESATRTLTESFEDYTSELMPNGTNPRITYFAIGSDAVPVTQQENKGIYTYSCQKPSQMIDTMSAIADRVSGRTRLETSDIKVLDDKTIEVTSTVPLLNIAVLAQETDAKIISAQYGNEVNIPVSRYADLNFQEYMGVSYDELIGGAYLLGDSKSVIGTGTYRITFDKKISAEDLVVLFEPALEMRMVVTVNGKKIDDPSDLNDTMEGDKVSVRCTLYEMGTDNEISSDLLPENTSYDIYVYEDGGEVKHVSGKEMTLDEYELKNIETKIVASVRIGDFKPIEYGRRFTPAPYASSEVYSISAAFDNDVRSARFDTITSNSDMKLRFTIAENGEVMTDAAAVKALNPQIEVYPEGNSGDVQIESDGTVTFTPKAAKFVPDSNGSFDVSVTCTLSDGTSAVETYTVLTADYKIVADDMEGTVPKNGFYGNTLGAAFRITKDGEQLSRDEVESGVKITVNEEYQNLKLDIHVDEDGTIHCIPSSEQETDRRAWVINWWYYLFELPGADLTVTLSHTYGTARAVIDVTDADIGYIFGWVVAPLATEIILLAAVIAYIVRLVTKPRFSSNAMLYVGSISYISSGLGAHRMTLKPYRLRTFNSFKNMWNPFKPLTARVGNISVSAEKNNRIIVNEAFPWFVTDELRSREIPGIIDAPSKICETMHHTASTYIEVNEIEPRNIRADGDKTLRMNSRAYYCVKVSAEYGEGALAEQARRINRAKVVCYTSEGH